MSLLLLVNMAQTKELFWVKLSKRHICLMFDSFNYIFFWQMCCFTHIFCRSAVVSSYCKSLSHLQQCIIGKMCLLHLLSQSMSQKHKNVITRQTLTKIANTMFATPANLPFLGSNELSCSHLLKRQAVPNVYFLLQFTTV